jgi:REP element-mobilizing transposase RayT
VHHYPVNIHPPGDPNETSWTKSTPRDEKVRIFKTVHKESSMPYWKLYYHITWGTKNRLSLIDKSFEARLHSAIAAKALELEAIVHAVGGIGNHVHLAVSVPPKIAISDFIGQVKGNSAHFVNYVVHPDFEFHWQAEYGIHSFGEKNLHFVVDYVKRQHAHHEQGTILNNMEQTES